MLLYLTLRNKHTKDEVLADKRLNFIDTYLFNGYRVLVVQVTKDYTLPPQLERLLLHESDSYYMSINVYGSYSYGHVSATIHKIMTELNLEYTFSCSSNEDGTNNFGIYVKTPYIKTYRETRKLFGKFERLEFVHSII